MPHNGTHHRQHAGEGAVLGSQWETWSSALNTVPLQDQSNHSVLLGGTSLLWGLTALDLLQEASALGTFKTQGVASSFPGGQTPCAIARAVLRGGKSGQLAQAPHFGVPHSARQPSHLTACHPRAPLCHRIYSPHRLICPSPHTLLQLSLAIAQSLAQTHWD